MIQLRIIHERYILFSADKEKLRVKSTAGRTDPATGKKKYVQLEADHTGPTQKTGHTDPTQKTDHTGPTQKTDHTGPTEKNTCLDSAHHTGQGFITKLPTRTRQVGCEPY